MARKKDKPYGEAGAQAETETRDHYAMSSTSNGSKPKLPNNEVALDGRPSRLPKAHPTPQPILLNDGLQSKPGHNTKTLPRANAEGNLNQSTRGLPNNKRPRDNGSEEHPHSPDKRPKLNSNAGLDHRPDIDTTDTPTSPLGSAASIAGTTSRTPMQALPAAVQHLGDKYEFSTMSILSSSKIEGRVRNLLQRTGNFSFAKPGAKPEVVILTSKGKVAIKMCSIVEIAKEQIKKEKGKYWQYSTLHPELVKLKPKISKPRGGRILAESDKEKGRNDLAETQATDGPEDASIQEQNYGGETEDDEDEDVNEAFETMTNPKERDRGTLKNGRGDEKKVRSAPVVTIFFARVPVPGLKEIYGEQTNA